MSEFERWKRAPGDELRVLARAAIAEHERQANRTKKPQWWNLRLEGGLLPAEKEYWYANGYYRCQCGTEARAQQSRRIEAPWGDRVDVCPACGGMCVTLWTPIEPPMESVATVRRAA